MGGYSGSVLVLAVSLTLLVYASLGAVINKTQNPQKNPIVFIPGDGGNRAYARPRGAPANQSAKLIWLNLKDFFVSRSITEMFSLYYDDQLRSHDSDRYEILFPGWGDTETVSTLDSNERIFGRYLDSIIKDLKRDPYFVSNKSLRGAPYDFRRAPYENEQFFDRLKLLVEETYRINNNSRVILVGHSLGCLMTFVFLDKQTVEWKKQYVKSFVSLGGPYGGAVKTLRIAASGDNFNVFFRSPLAFRDLQRSFASLYFMAPDQRLWPANETLVITPKRNYTSGDYKQFFEDIGFPIGYQLIKRAFEGIDFFKGPTGVDEVYCLYGTSISTDDKFVYSPPSLFRKRFPNQIPAILYADGDRSVNLRSLEVCRMWTNVKIITLPFVGHIEMVRSPKVFELLRRISGFSEKSTYPQI